MAEYIEREELKKVLSNEAVHCLTFQKTGEARGLIKAKEIISKLPSADLVEVVRCKECKYKVDTLGRTMCSRTAIKKGNGWYGLTAIEKNHFCSYGELKEREGKCYHD